MAIFGLSMHYVLSGWLPLNFSSPFVLNRTGHHRPHSLTSPHCLILPTTIILPLHPITIIFSCASCPNQLNLPFLITKLTGSNPDSCLSDELERKTNKWCSCYPFSNLLKKHTHRTNNLFNSHFPELPLKRFGMDFFTNHGPFRHPTSSENALGYWLVAEHNVNITAYHRSSLRQYDTETH